MGETWSQADLRSDTAEPNVLRTIFCRGRRLIHWCGGTRIPAFGMHEWQMKNCIRLGTYCCGGTPELKRQATNDLIAFPEVRLLALRDGAADLQRVRSFL